MNLDDIKYGNTTREQEQKVREDRSGIIKACEEKGIIKDILENRPFPANSSEETRNELDYLVKLTKDASEEDLKFCKLIETNHYDFFVIVAKKLGLDVSKEEILNGLVIWTRFYFTLKISLTVQDHINWLRN